MLLLLLQVFKLEMVFDKYIDLNKVSSSIMRRRGGGEEEVISTMFSLNLILDLTIHVRDI